MKIKAEYLSKIQRLCMRLFEIEDGEDMRGRNLVVGCIDKWLKKITDDEDKQIEIWDIVDKYKFDKDWNRTLQALEAAGYEVEKNDI